MDKSLIERIAALKAKASGDPKSIDAIVDSVSPDDEFIQKVVEKIMSKMDADSEFAKYRVDAQGTNKKQAALARAFSLLKQAFDMPPVDAPAPMGGGIAPSPMDKAFGETQATEDADAGMPALAPVEKLEEEAHKYGDPALDALVNVIEMLIKKDMGVKDHSTEEPAKDAAPAPFGGADDEVVEEDDAAPAPFAVAEEKPEAPKKKSPPKVEKSDEGEDDKSEPEEDEAPEEDDKEEEDKKPPVEAARKRVKALISLPEAQRIAKAAELRNLAKVVEAGELPDFLKDEEDSSDDKKVDEEKMEKEALKTVFRAALAALEAGENDEEYTMPADPEKRKDKQEDLEKEAAADRKQLVLAHLAKLRMQKEATVDGKSMPTPKEVPSPEGTVEDNLSGDAKVQYSPATADRPISTIETKKQKLPTDKTHGDEAVMYFGDTPESKEEIQTEKDSAKGVNNKRELKDMGTAVFSAEPASPTEHMEMGSGSHQKTKDWETAKSESDKTPSGPRLVGLAAEKDITGRAVKLARLAQSKGMITNEDQFDEMVSRYASYDDAKFALACEVVEEAPAISAKATRKVAQETVFSDNEAVEDEGHVDEEVPETKKEAILRAAKERAEASGMKRTGGLQVPIVSVGSGDRPMMPEVSNPRFASLADTSLFNWTGPTSEFLQAEQRGTLDKKIG